MSESAIRVVPIADWRSRVLPIGMPWNGQTPLDRLQRPIHDLRISITDRCNFRCSYCMPKSVFDKHHQFLPQAELLSFEEITRVAAVFAQLGVKKLRLTGGEPLLRKGVEDLVAQLADLRTPSGQPLELTLTTNASLLAKKAVALRQAGLNRITVSLDALNDRVFRAMNDVDFPVADVLRGIEAARDSGFADAPGGLKVNMVVKRGTNDSEILPMARHFKGSGVVLRFIEYMDVGNTNGWRMDEVLPSAEVVSRIHSELPLNPAAPGRGSDTAERHAFADGSGEIGTISSVTQAFCRDCSRARLSTDGKLYTCLFASSGHDLRAPLRAGASNDTLLGALAHTWGQRQDRYSELRASGQASAQGPKRVEMSYIGG